MYRHGGIYCDFKAQAVRPFDGFLKYEIVFNDADFTVKHYGNPTNVGNGNLAGRKNCYFLKKVLNELISV